MDKVHYVDECLRRALFVNAVIAREEVESTGPIGEPTEKVKCADGQGVDDDLPHRNGTTTEASGSPTQIPNHQAVEGGD